MTICVEFTGNHGNLAVECPYCRDWVYQNGEHKMTEDGVNTLTFRDVDPMADGCADCQHRAALA